MQRQEPSAVLQRAREAAGEAPACKCAMCQLEGLACADAAMRVLLADLRERLEIRVVDDGEGGTIRAMPSITGTNDFIDELLKELTADA